MWGGFIWMIFAKTNRKKKKKGKRRKQAVSRHFTSINQRGDPLCRTRCVLGEKQSQLGLFYAAEKRYHVFFYLTWNSKIQDDANIKYVYHYQQVISINYYR